jgi:type I restriction enzyme S subunit
VHLAEFDGAASAEFIVFPPSEAIEQRFLQSLLRSPDYRVLADQRSTGDRPRVKFGNVSDFEFSLPPLAEQERIVRKLDTLSARTRNARIHLTAIEKLAEKYKAGVLAAAFSGHEESAKFGSLIDGIKAGKNLKCDERPPEEGERGTVKVSAVTWGEFRPDQSKTYPPHFEPDPDTLIKPGDFLFSRANTIELVGAVVIVEQTPGNLFLSDKVLRIDMSEDLKLWLMWFLRSPQGRNQLEEISSGNQQSMRNIGQAKLKTVDVPLPDEDTRTSILGAIRSSFEKIDRLQTEAQKALRAAERLDERILAKAFAGKLVPQDPNDEPASVLLDRIREARANAPKKTRPRRTKATAMKKDPKDLLLADIAKWPANGVTSEELAKRVVMPRDDLRDALFELLGGTTPQLEQVFDKAEERMRLKRVAQ